MQLVHLWQYYNMKMRYGTGYNDDTTRQNFNSISDNEQNEGNWYYTIKHMDNLIS